MNLIIFYTKIIKIFRWCISAKVKTERAYEKIINLGVILDENLNRKSKILHVANKVSKSIGIIRKSKFYLLTKSLRTLCFSPVQPYFFYCNLILASTYKSNLVRLEILQKRMMRTIAKTHFYAHTDPIFRKLGILKFHDIHLFQLGLFMYSYQNGFGQNMG